MWLHGNSVVVGYRTGDMDVREAYGIEGPSRIVTRTLELGPSAALQTLVVLDAPEGAKVVPDVVGGQRLVMLRWQPRGSDGYDDEGLGGSRWAPSRGDYLDASSGTGATVSFVRVRARAAERRRPRYTDTARHSAAVARRRRGDHECQDESAWSGSTSKVKDKERDNGRFLVAKKRSCQCRASARSRNSGNGVQQYGVFASDAEQRDPAAADPRLPVGYRAASTAGNRRGDRPATSQGWWARQSAVSALRRAPRQFVLHRDRRVRGQVSGTGRRRRTQPTQRRLRAAR